MPTAFNQGKADFSELVEDSFGVHISKVVHKTFIDVNTGGVEAAAATGIQKSSIFLRLDQGKI